MNTLTSMTTLQLWLEYSHELAGKPEGKEREAASAMSHQWTDSIFLDSQVTLNCATLQNLHKILNDINSSAVDTGFVHGKVLRSYKK